jgi:hypothetical protein
MDGALGVVNLVIVRVAVRVGADGVEAPQVSIRLALMGIGKWRIHLRRQRLRIRSSLGTIYGMSKREAVFAQQLN